VLSAEQFLIFHCYPLNVKAYCYANNMTMKKDSRQNFSEIITKIVSC